MDNLESNKEKVLDFMRHTNEFIRLFDRRRVHFMVNSYLCKIEKLQDDLNEIVRLQTVGLSLNPFLGGYSIGEINTDGYYDEFVELAKKIATIAARLITDGCVECKGFMCYTGSLLTVADCGGVCSNCKVQHEETKSKAKIKDILAILDDLRDKLKEIDG